MKAVSSHGSGPWGKLFVVAGTLILLVSVALFLGGCGDDNEENTSSQLDESTTTDGGSSTVSDVGSAGGATGNGEPQEDVMVNYSWDECIADMTFRYADDDVASRVCGSIRTDYGDRESTELDSILPAVEAQENVSPDQGGGTSGGDTGDATGGTGGTGGNTGGGSSGGWGEIEIQVPSAP